MDDQTISGYQEVAHTADWALRVWAPDLPHLLETAVRGMYSLMGLQFDRSQPEFCQFTIRYEDHESLLVAFLSEILYLIESESISFDEFRLAIGDDLLHADLYGYRVADLAKEIKAVTFHNLVIQHVNGKLEATIVFDV